jgi:hypothetical protein
MRKTAMETSTMVSKRRKNRLKMNFAIINKFSGNRALGMINPAPIKKPFHHIVVQVMKRYWILVSGYRIIKDSFIF